MRSGITTLLLVNLVLWSAGIASAQSFIQADGQSFTLCNQPFKFVGFNARGICHYGKGDVLPYSSASHITASLDYCTASKSRVIRVFCAYKNIGAVETGNRLQTILDACAARGIYVLVSLTDQYSASQMHPQGDSVYYTLGGCCGLVMLNDTFYSGGYTNNYLPQVLYLADRFKNHPAVFAWQLGNEIRALNGSIFHAFCQSVRQQIRAVDPNHMIGIGLIDSSFAGTSATALYADFDFISTHNYNGGGVNDAGIASSLNKPYLVGEAGFDSTIYGPDRTPETNNDMNLWFNQRGVDGYLQWGLMASTYDNGDGDWYFGVDKVLGNHDQDYVLYGQLFHTWASSFESPPSLAVLPDALSVTLGAGSAPPPADTFQVGSAGTTALNYSISESVPWLSVNPTSGQAGCDYDDITIQYNAAIGDLPPGSHAGQIAVSAPGAANSPQTVTVTVHITSPPCDYDGDFDVDLDDYAELQLCLLGTGIIQNDPACERMKLNGDLFVDSADVQFFVGCMSGSNVPSDPDCLQAP